MEEENKKSNWYSQKTSDILSELESSEKGLSSEEASIRLKKYGLNELPETKPDGLITIFIRQFKSRLIYLLLGAAGIVFLMHEWVDGLIILFVLLFNAIVGTIQAGRAQNTLLALKKFAETNATVVRDGKELILPDKQVVPGDIIILQEGEKVPADARIIESSNLRLAEAVLTGESEPVSKTIDDLKNANLSISDQKNMVFKGSNVVGGTGKAVVVETGVKTVIGEISQKITSIDTEIPLQANVRRLSHLIIFAVIILSVLIFSLGLFLGKEVEEMLKLSVAVIVSAIPEGLPIVMTLLLATGVWRMSKKNVLVKRLQAVEALGEARVIAVDKTGTITKNELVVQKIYTNGKAFNVTGVGYELQGQVEFEGEAVSAKEDPCLTLAGTVGVICSNAKLTFKEDVGKWKVGGDPTEAAMMVYSQKSGFSKDEINKQFKKIDEIPFDSKLKYHAVEAEDLESGEKIAFVAGASEILLNSSNKIFIGGKEKKLTDSQKIELTKIFESMSSEGLRVIAFAFKKTDSEKLSPDNLEDLVFVGFFGMKDAIREEVPEALRAAQSAGIKVSMITGDHKYRKSYSGRCRYL
jgi:P-type Ca2+ transporter type 2C